MPQGGSLHCIGVIWGTHWRIWAQRRRCTRRNNRESAPAWKANKSICALREQIIWGKKHETINIKHTMGRLMPDPPGVSKCPLMPRSPDVKSLILCSIIYSEDVISLRFQKDIGLRLCWNCNGIKMITEKLMVVRIQGRGSLQFNMDLNAWMDCMGSGWKKKSTKKTTHISSC